jgi:pimeloyl-ACP methyl ester carboxylesterase
MPFYQLVLLSVFVALLSLLIVTRMGITTLEGRYPPAGDFVKIDDEVIHYVERNGFVSNAATVVAIHGASGNLMDPLRALDEKLEAFYRRIYIDRPGSGWSSRNGSADASPRVQAERIIKALDAIGLNEPAVFVGHSWGASVIAQIALLAPEKVKGLLFVAPASHPWPGGVSWHYEVATKPVVGKFFSELLVLPAGWFMVPQSIESVFAPEDVPDNYLENIGARLVLRPLNFRSNAQDVANLNSYLTDLAKDYTRINVPTMIITGKQDDVVLPEIHSEGLHRDIITSNLIILEDAGHMPHHTHTSVVADSIHQLAELSLQEPDGIRGFDATARGLASPPSP